MKHHQSNTLFFESNTLFFSLELYFLLTDTLKYWIDDYGALSLLARVIPLNIIFSFPF
jgi:hypothetical protein